MYVSLLGELLLASHGLLGLHGPQTPPVEHGLVLFPAIAGRGQHLLAREDGVSAGHEAHHLLLFTHCVATSSQADDGSGKDQTGGGNGAQYGVERDGLALTERRTLDGHQGVHRERLGVCRKGGHGVDQSNVVLGLLTQAEDASGAHVDACLLHIVNGGKALVVGACGDDAGVVLARGIYVVVVGSEAGVLELAGLLSIDHAESDAGLHAQGAHALDHLGDVLEVGLAAAHVAPGGAHAEARAAVLLCDAGSLEHRLDVDHLGGLEPRAVARRLGAVAAVLAAPARLDVHEGAHLDGGGVVEAAVDGGLGGG